MSEKVFTVDEDQEAEKRFQTDFKGKSLRKETRRYEQFRRQGPTGKKQETKNVAIYTVVGVVVMWVGFLILHLIWYGKNPI